MGVGEKAVKASEARAHPDKHSNFHAFLPSSEAKYRTTLKSYNDLTCEGLDWCKVFCHVHVSVGETRRPPTCFFHSGCILRQYARTMFCMHSLRRHSDT